jgi:hypothetical protein
VETLRVEVLGQEWAVAMALTEPFQEAEVEATKMRVRRETALRDTC